MAQGVLWIVLPAVVYGALAWVVLDDPPRTWSRLRAALTRHRERRASHTPRDGAAVVDEAPAAGPGVAPPAREPVRRPTAPPDPFDVLVVQVQLGRLTAQMRALDADPHAWARGRRMLAAQAAYDALLAEACRLAGVPVEQEWSPEPWGPTREPERFREEMELASRGWSW
ncbi:hypothetical protein [Actinotalea solisilvae]|uniref:hypothetical protein n=1 Tax=Actinotalea solisilvae TaxID=2072922 RepID=UPI001F1C8D63|nr:hypothetical protein [Actinotalea solisilvae]